MRKVIVVVCVFLLMSGPIWSAPKKQKKPADKKQAKPKGGRKGKGKVQRKPPAGGRRPSGGGAKSTAGFSDRAVEQAIQKGCKYLLSKQGPGGNWPARNKYKVGPGALATYALLESGINPQNPKMMKALTWLSRNRTEKTYGLGLRANVWLSANRHTSDKYRGFLMKDAKMLWLSAHNGAYDYESPGKSKGGRWDNSNSQYGVLGVWAAAMNLGEVPSAYWKAVLTHWKGCQNGDGGWGYRTAGKGGQGGSRATMTAGGVATCFVCFDSLYAQDFVKCNRKLNFPPIERGLAWLDKNFAKTLGGQKHLYYYLYGVERVGLASGYKYFGKQDWYKLGATNLLRRQSGNGSWGNDLADTAFALLFLIRGRNAIVFNKLEFDGDWNNRPRELASLTRWMSRTFERTVNWQIINLKVPVGEWHDAQILYISGAMKPNFTDAHINKLRQFVHQGGTIFSATECGGLGFKKGIREVYAKLFPEHKLTPLGPEHIIYSDKIQYRLAGAKPRMEMITNGVRPLVIHTDMDVPLSWQLSRTVSHKWAFQAAVNIVRYVTGNITTHRPRGVTHWPPPPKATPGRTVKLARLRHAGNFNPEPLAYTRFARLMAQNAGVGVEVVGPISANRLAGSGASVATLTGTGKLELSAGEITALKRFVDDGGTLVIDAAGGCTTFAASAKRVVEKMYGVMKLRTLSSTSKVLRLEGKAIAKVKYRRRTSLRLGRQTTPALRGVLVGSGRRVGIYLSREDLTAGLVGYTSYTVDGYAPDSAFEIMRNIVLTAGK